MKKQVPNPSNYWSDFESDTVYYIFKWSGTTAQKTLETREKDFLTAFASLTFKYGIALPHYNDLSEVDKWLDTLETHVDMAYPENWIHFRFNELYQSHDKLGNSSILFVKNKDGISRKRIVNLETLATFEETVDNPGNGSAYPVHIDFFKDQITLRIQNDVFFTELDNKKTKSDESLGAKGNWVDNAELATLNTPRFNSFLNEFKILALQYGAEFLFENYYDNEGEPPRFFTEEGILMEGEIVCYEDVMSVLPEKFQI
jgi:hypothetical protein